MRIFISYSTKDGIELAKQARSIFNDAGHAAWMYEHDRTIGASVWTEISNIIARGTDVFFPIITASSRSCDAQIREANYALNSRVKVLTVRLDDAEVPTLLTADNYEPWQRSAFTEECAKLAQRLPEVMAKIQALGSTFEAEQESSHLRQRFDRIKELNGRIAKLDKIRIAECRDSVLQSYSAATLPRNIAGLHEESDIDRAKFRTIGIWQRVKLNDFNAINFIWNPYFEDVGRAVASGERKYLHEVLGQQLESDKDSISLSSPQFSILTETIRSRDERELPFDTLLAPVQTEVLFVKHYRDNMDWSSRPPVLTMGRSSLRVFWSHRYAPLDRFIICSSKASTWHVVPDEQTGRPLSVAIGQSKLFPEDEVEYAVETTVWHELNRPDGIRVVSLRD